MKTIKFFLIFLVILIVAVSCSSAENSVRIRESDFSAPINDNTLESNWVKDESGNFRILKYKPGGDNIPYVDNEICFAGNLFMYSNESQGSPMYGYMDFEFNKITDLMSKEISQFYNGIAEIKEDEGVFYINDNLEILPDYYPGYLYFDNQIVEIDNSVDRTPYSFVVGDVESDSYLVPARLFASDDSESEYLVGFTTVGKATSSKLLIENDFIIKPQYEEAELFHEGFAAVKTDGKWGYIDSQGNLVIDCMYVVANNFSDGVAGVLNSIAISRYGRQIPNYSKKWSIIDKSNNLIIDNMYRYIGMYEDGIAIAKYEPADSWFGNQTYLNTEGEDLLGRRPSPNNLKRYAGEYFAITNGNDHYFLNEQYEYIFNKSYSRARDFSEGLAAVKTDNSNSWGYIDVSGNLVIDEEYLYAGDFKNSFAFVFMKETRSGYLIDKEAGKYLEELNLSGMSKFNEEGYALAYVKGESTADKDGRIYYMIQKVNND